MEAIVQALWPVLNGVCDVRHVEKSSLGVSGACVLQEV